MPDPAAVVNASPLILLAKASRLDLLRVAGAQVAIPQAVFDEVAVPSDRLVVQRIAEAGTLFAVVPDPPLPAPIEHWDLGRGESAVLAYALAHPPTEAILDDLAARRCAQALGLPCRGTLGLVLTAKKRGLIPAARPMLLALIQNGMYLSDAIIKSALRRVNE